MNGREARGDWRRDGQTWPQAHVVSIKLQDFPYAQSAAIALGSILHLEPEPPVLRQNRATRTSSGTVDGDRIEPMWGVGTTQVRCGIHDHSIRSAAGADTHGSNEIEQPV